MVLISCAMGVNYPLGDDKVSTVHSSPLRYNRWKKYTPTIEEVLLKFENIKPILKLLSVSWAKYSYWTSLTKGY